MELDLLADAVSKGTWTNMQCKCSTVSSMNSLIKTISWAYGIDLRSASWETWMNLQRLPVSVMNALYKNIFWVQLYWLISSVSQQIFYLLGNLNECAEASCVSDECPLQDHLLSSPSHWHDELWLPRELNECSEASLCQPMVSLWALSPRWPEWTCRGFPVAMINTLYKTIFWIAHHIDLINPDFPDNWTNVQRFPCVSNEYPLQDHLPRMSSVSWEIWMNMLRLSCVCDEHTLQDHLLNGPAYWLHEICFPRELNKCAEASLC